MVIQKQIPINYFFQGKDKCYCPAAYPSHGTHRGMHEGTMPGLTPIFSMSFFNDSLVWGILLFSITSFSLIMDI
jgi:hypothetical protein